MSTEQHEPGVQLDQNQFCCPVCLDLLKEPVTVPCGHSYCRRCIEDCWDQEDKKGQCSCPQCRDTFSPRPVLKRNTMLAELRGLGAKVELVEKLKRSGPQQPSAPLARAGPHDVACDFCSGAGPNKATMSCLTCMASYCPAHLEPHRRVPVLKKHELVSVTIPLQEKMCEKHNKLVEVYCRTDRKCICYLCVIDEHKGHDTLSSASERAEEQKQLLASQKKVKQRFQKRGKELKELLQVLKNFKSSFEPAEKTCDEIFDEMIRSVQKRRGEAKQLIGAQREAAVARAEELQLQLETEMSEMKKRDNDLELLSRTDDHIHFIQTFQSLSTFGESADLPAVLVFYPQHASFKPVTDCLFKLKDDMESLLKDAWPTVCARVSAIEVVPPVPKTREEFLRYRCPLTLDRNSISQYLTISTDNRRATSTYKNDYYENKRYGYNNAYQAPIPIMQVSCSEGLSERCYWEVSWSGSTWSVGVLYKDSSRSQNLEFGTDTKSWSLTCSPNSFSFQHNNKSKQCLVRRSLSSVGVYLDYKLGTLSFYDISYSMTLLHEEHVRFTELPYPCFELKGSQNNLTGHFVEVKKLW
ncbi:tripartite motif-containing protein 16-like isoform X2 [Pungitius pungitius]|uniref:tripartite motif-containing protein 16-like isoform X2 n=1 Tax=Pungitius pungitius TaxID=134920 RepID=UPI002E13A61B